MRGGGVPIRELWPMASAGRGGERERRRRRFDPWPHLGPGWSEAAGRRERAATALGGGGGGAAAGERRRAGFGEVGVVVVELGGLFIAEGRRWSGGVPVVAGRRPLMAPGVAAARFAAAQG